MKTKYLLLPVFLSCSLLLCSCVPVENSVSENETPSEPIIRSRMESIPDTSIKMTPEMDLYPPVLHSDEYYEPVPMPYPVNTAGGEDSPFITPDGNTFYVFFTPDVSVPVEQQVLDGVTGIYVSVLNDEGNWSEPERVVLSDSESLDGCTFVQGDKMWFCSVRKGYSGIHWFTADCDDGQWQNFQYSGLNLLEGYEVGELHISSDGTELYFHSPRPGGAGGYDIWLCRNVDGRWQEPENIRAVNSEDTDGWPYLSEDGSELWFTRFYNGSPAVFRSYRIGGEWQEPELIVSQFAGEPTLDNRGNLYFTHHYYKDALMIEADIYVARKK